MRESRAEVVGVRPVWRQFVGCCAAGLFVVGLASCGQEEGADSAGSPSTTQTTSEPEASNTTSATSLTDSLPSVADCIEDRDRSWPDAVTSHLPWPGAEDLLEVRGTTTARTVGEVTGLQAAVDHLGITLDAADTLSWDKDGCDFVLDEPTRMRVGIGIRQETDELVLDSVAFGAGSFPGMWPIGDGIQFGPLLEGRGAAGCAEETAVRFGDVEATATGDGGTEITVTVPDRPSNVGGRIVRRVTCDGQMVRLLAWGVPNGDFAAG